MKAFTAQEKEYYLEQLIQKGKAVFSQYGIKKTTVEDLTKAVGIAKGSFYLFFPTKEDLYFHILTRQVGFLRQQAMAKLMQADREPYLLLKELLNGIIKSIQADPILAIAFTAEGRELLARDAIRKQLKTDGEIKSGLKELLSIMIEKGIVRRLDPDLLVNLVRTIFILNTNKEMLDEEYFDQTMELMIDSIARTVAVE